ncbi:MAG: hypothetical protein QMD50_02830 [Patescibacteria group bacterium]|nr:hypothetical protein [Patescibacteria group bacterium]
MKFFEKIFSKQELERGVKNLHPEFHISYDGVWYFNREFSSLRDTGINIKSRFGFEDPSLLDGCEFLAKIGVNEDHNIPTSFIGFAYTKDAEKESLAQWVQRFPYSEIINDLDNEGVSRKDSKVEIVKAIRKSGE